MSIIVIETHSKSNTEWGISFNGHNPKAEHYFGTKNKDDAFRLRELILAKLSPVSSNSPVGTPCNEL